MGENEPPALGGLVLTEGHGFDPVPKIGEIINPNGREHVVVGKKARYNVERDRWEINIKLEAIRTPTIHQSEYLDTPQWVQDVFDFDKETRFVGPAETY